MESWRVRGSYFEGCNCEAICPCRSVADRPGGSSTFGECYGALSWWIEDGHADDLDLSGLKAAMVMRYLDRVEPSTPWEVVMYVDEGGNENQRAALADIFLGRAGGTVADQYGSAIGTVHAIRPARIDLVHAERRKRIHVPGYIELEAEDEVEAEGPVRCGVPGFDHPGTEMYNDVARSTDPALRWEVRGRGASFVSDFDYRSD